MEGLEVLVVTLAAFFGLGIFFAILLWCRSWKRETREQSEKQLQVLRAQTERLRDAVEMLDHTTASLQTADGQLTRQLEDLRNSVHRLQSVRPDAKETSAPKPSDTVEEEVTDSPPDSVSTGDRYENVQALLKAGRSTVEIAHQLDIGVAEVRMIARMKTLKSPDPGT